MNTAWVFSSSWRRTWFTLGVIIVVAAGIAFGRLLAVEGHRAWLMAADYPPPPEGMVLVPAGWFWLGSDRPEADPDVPALQRVFLPAFYIDQHEVTNAEFREVFPEHTYPEGQDDVPASQVLRGQALAYAAAIGHRLPGGAEWELSLIHI